MTKEVAVVTLDAFCVGRKRGVAEPNAALVDAWIEADFGQWLARKRGTVVVVSPLAAQPGGPEAIGSWMVERLRELGTTGLSCEVMFKAVPPDSMDVVSARTVGESGGWARVP